MGTLDHKYREGVREYILGLTPERKKDFHYQLLRQVSLHKRDLRDMKEQLAEELAALAFLEAEMYTIPFKRRESDQPTEKAPAETKTVRKDRRTA